LALLAGGALLWTWLAACGVSLASLFWPEWAHSSQAVLLPVRTAVSFPFVLLALLAFLGISASSSKGQQERLPSL